MKLPFFKKSFGLIDLVIILAIYFGVPMLFDAYVERELMLPRGTKISEDSTPTLFWLAYTFYMGAIMLGAYGLVFWQIAGKQNKDKYDQSGNRKDNS